MHPFETISVVSSPDFYLARSLIRIDWKRSTWMIVAKPNVIASR
jgi:hypothetical protein